MPMPVSPAEFAKLIAEQKERWGKVIGRQVEMIVCKAQWRAQKVAPMPVEPRALYSKPRARSIFFRNRRQYLVAPGASGGLPCPAPSRCPPGSSLEDWSLDRGVSVTEPVVIGPRWLGLSASALGTQSPAGLNASPAGH